MEINLISLTNRKKICYTYSMLWKENGTGSIGKDGDWSAYVRQDNVMCVWKVFKGGHPKGSGFADNLTVAKQRAESVVKFNKEK